MKEKSCQSQLQLYNFLKKKGGGHKRSHHSDGFRESFVLKLSKRTNLLANLPRCLEKLQLFKLMRFCVKSIQVCYE